MQKLIAWVKTNKLSASLIAVLAFFILSNYSSPFGTSKIFVSEMGYGGDMGFSGDTYNESVGLQKVSSPRPPIGGGGAPQLDITDRMVSTNSTLSLVVANVRDSIKAITTFAKGSGGYMVNANQTAPEGLANGTISIRVPSERLDDTLEFLRNSSVKVVSESVNGGDLTDQYVDVEARLGTLESTKSRYETILDKAEDVDEILRVTQQILNIQNQIDSLKGQLQYLDATSRSSLITIYLSTDEFELPYAPDAPWRPSVIFKYAARGVVGTLLELAEVLIWVGVYAVLWVPLLLVALYIRKRTRQKQSPLNTK